MSNASARTKLAQAGAFNHKAPQNGNRTAIKRLNARIADYRTLKDATGFHFPGSMKK